VWLTGNGSFRDHKTIADFRQGQWFSKKVLRRQFVELCRKMGLLAKAQRLLSTAASSRPREQFRDNNFTQGQIQRRQKQIEEERDALHEPTRHRRTRRTAAGRRPSEAVLLTKNPALRKSLAKLDEEGE